MAVISAEAKGIATYLDQVPASDLAGADAARSHVLAAAQRLVARLQTPVERLMEVNFMPPVLVGAMQTFAALGRICRVLTSQNLLNETGEDRYSATKMVDYLGDKENFPDEQLRAFSDHWRYGGPSLSEHLQQTNYKEPQDPQNAAFKLHNPERAEFWTRCKENPALQATFGRAMEGWTRTKTPWPEFYDTQALLNGADLEKPIVVDVGGNIGRDLMCFLAKHPDVPSGSLVLQDRPEAIELAAVDNKIQKMSHDFFTPQPVVGSRAYFLHAVLHDWPDKEAIQILQQLAKAMTKGYSKLLVSDVAIPAVGASGIQAAMDVAMMSLVSARERTIEDWTQLLTKSGFKIIKWWDDPQKFECVIEAELA